MKRHVCTACSGPFFCGAGPITDECENAPHPSVCGSATCDPLHAAWGPHLRALKARKDAARDAARIAAGELPVKATEQARLERVILAAGDALAACLGSCHVEGIELWAGKANGPALAALLVEAARIRERDAEAGR